MKELNSQASNPQRAEWLALLARAECEYLESLWADLGKNKQPQIISGPETGLLQLTTRAGGGAVAFQFGEATCSRCVIQLGKVRGYAVQLGSNLRKAELAAYLDALFQELGDEQRHIILVPIRERLAQINVEREMLVSSTSVQFFTTKTS
ncbi:phosphonate C-P lyase system protein PhnG [Oligella ureolytica]|uniref:Phosphonate C-P lyase system protein PhnG n=1 Tax=Oligella ureolytica TaxID=90244 RepID=A0A378XGS4_9BURK|nr:phosphonate C-P lyase system protein PhnG [Oligella ureolytica]QPT39687.1 phosphonate C-P lyase system protein PhnG [Oligella ureolytica]SUA52432.1 phosphonate C-P lyase system protein PhnG [Oligella ureolytica]SUA57193.1 phosphonate C-P lyase system protein PhnG [Oligella ureolytica]